MRNALLLLSLFTQVVFTAGFPTDLQCASASPRLFPKSSGQQVTANNDFISMSENGSWIIPVLNNDYGLTSGISDMNIMTHPEHGTAIITSTYQISYTPNPSYIGEDYFEYRVCNKNGNCGEASVSVLVKDFDYVPIAHNDEVIYYNDSTSVFNVLVNDKNLYDVPLELAVVTDLNFGTSTVTDDLKLNLGFTSFFIKKDSLTYQICDQEGDCDQAILYVTPHQDKSSTLIIPEAFSANNDGFNDTFRVPQFDYYEKLSLFVFNINGIPVFKSDDYENDWDGTANTGPLKGHLVPQGTYYYLLKIAGTTEELKGSIYITH